MTEATMKKFATELNENTTLENGLTSAIDGKEGHAMVEAFASYAQANGHDLAEADVISMLTKATEMQNGDFTDEQLDGVAGGWFFQAVLDSIKHTIKNPVKSAEQSVETNTYVVKSFAKEGLKILGINT